MHRLSLVPTVQANRYPALGDGDPSEDPSGSAICPVRYAAMTNLVRSSVSVVVPTFGNAQGLEALAGEISKVLQGENRTFEILFVS